MYVVLYHLSTVYLLNTPVTLVQFLTSQHNMYRQSSMSYMTATLQSVNATCSPTWPAVHEKLFTTSREESPEDFGIHDTHESPSPASPCTQEDSVSLTTGALVPSEGASFPSEGYIFTTADLSLQVEGSAQPSEGGRVLHILLIYFSPRREKGECTINESVVITPRPRLGRKVVRTQRYRNCGVHSCMIVLLRQSKHRRRNVELNWS